MNEAGGKSGGDQAGQLAVRTGRFGDDKDPVLGKDTRFKPGQSGNLKGRPKGKTLSATIQEMLGDEHFIERLTQGVKDKTNMPDPEFQDTPMRAMLTLAIIEAMNPNEVAKVRRDAREFLGKFGYGTKVDLTSNGATVGSNPFAELTVDELRKLAQGQQ